MNLEKVFERFTSNWWIKVLSIAIALVLFMFHRCSLVEERFFSVPLAILTEGNLVPASSWPRVVRLTLRGERNVIYPILEDDIEAFVDLDRYDTPGTYHAPIQVRKKGSAANLSGLEIRIDPMELTLALEQSQTRIVPVKPIFSGYLESGYELVSTTVNPVQVEVFGPASRVSLINEIPTEPMDLTGRNANFSGIAKLEIPDPLVNLRGAVQVDVSTVIQEAVLVRTLDRLPIILSGIPSGLTVRPELSFGTVTVRGAQNLLEQWEPEASLLTLDCSKILESSSLVLPITVSAPPQFTVLSYGPLEVRVEFERNSGETE